MAKSKTQRKPPASRPSRGKLSLSDLLHKLGNVLLWILVASAPLFVSVTADDSFRLPKLLGAEWLGLASLVAYALAAALDRPSTREGDRAGGPGWRAPALLAVAPVAVAASLGFFTSVHPALTRQALADLWIGVACLVGWSLALRSRELERYVRGLTIPAVLLGGFGVLQFHGVFRPFRFTAGEEAFRTGVTSLAGNVGDLASFLVLPALVAQWGLAGAIRRSRGETGGGARAKEEVRIPAVVWGLALAVTVYGLLVTQTLTALIALAAGSVVLWLLSVPPRRAVALVAAGAIAAGAVAVVVPPVRERIVRVGGALAEGDWNAALTGRLDGWRAAGWMVREHPVTGVGHGAYRARFAPAKLALSEDGVEFYPGHNDPFFANAHNDLLEALAEWGVVGGVALVWALFVLLRTLWRWRASASPAGWPLAVAGVTGGLILALGQFPFHLALVAYPYVVFLAWIFRRGAEAEAVEVGDPAAATEDEAAASPASGGPVWLPWLVAGALALALVAQTGRAQDRMSASKQLRVVEVVSEEMARTGRVAPQLTAGNFRLLREAADDDPAEIGVTVALGGQYMLLERYDQAIAVYREALEKEPRPEIYLNLGRALRGTGQDAEAQEAFEKAITLAPNLRRELPPGVRVRRR